MGTKLYVANLPHPPSASALREHFSACGAVSEVEIILDRNVGRGRASAFVWMGSAAAAERARTELNRSSLGGQLLLVEAAPDDFTRRDRPATPAAPQRGQQQTESEAPARITLQFREPRNMTYELDCAGVAIALRTFFPTADGEWRIQVQTSTAPDAASTESTAASRVEALRNIARACREGGAVPALAHVDWEAVEQALVKVRAL
jgi:hypothetical protein